MLQLRNLRLLEVCDGNIVAPLGPKLVPVDSSIEGLVDGPFHAWFDDNEDADELRAVLAGILELIHEHGPFDIIYGFSQGAKVLAALLQDDVRQCLNTAHRSLSVARRSLHSSSVLSSSATAQRRTRRPSSSFDQMPGHRIRRPSSSFDRLPSSSSIGQTKRVPDGHGGAGRSSFDGWIRRPISSFDQMRRPISSFDQMPSGFTCGVAILACSGDVGQLRARLGLPELTDMHKVVSTPSVHIIGRQDNGAQKSLATARTFADESHRLVLYVCFLSLYHGTAAYKLHFVCADTRVAVMRFHANSRQTPISAQDCSRTLPYTIAIRPHGGRFVSASLSRQRSLAR